MNRKAEGCVEGLGLMSELLSPDNPLWTEVLGRIRHDVYHLPAYVRFLAGRESGTPAALLAGEGDAMLLAPLILRPISRELTGSDGWMDAASPYGYASPLISAAAGAPLIERLWDEARTCARRHRIVCAFFRLHPLLDSPVGESLSGSVVKEHGPTVWVPLDDAARLAQGIRKGHRCDIDKLKAEGFSVEIDNWIHLAAFGAVYRETMTRVGADALYRFPDDYFLEMRSSLPDRVHLGVVKSPEGHIAAAGLFSEYEGIVQYLFSGARTEFVRRAPTKLLLERMIRWACERKNRVFHLGGGVGGREDTLFRFKSGFSEQRASFRTIGMIMDACRYEEISRTWSNVTGRAPGSSDYFPVYRTAAK